MSTTPYLPQVVELFQRLPFAGRMEAGPGIFTGSAGDPSHGTEVRFWLKCQDGRIQAVSFQAYGCPHTLAAASWIAHQVRGMALPDVRRRDWLEAEQALGVPPEKRGRLLVIEDALKAAAGNAVENA